MTGIKVRKLSAVTAATLLLAAVAAAAPSGFTKLIKRPTSTGGTFELSAKHDDVGGLRGVCLNLEPRDAEGNRFGGSGGGCFGGDLSAYDGVAPVVFRLGSGERTTAALVAGIVSARARKVTVKFPRGKKLTTRAKRAPRRFRRELGVKVRYFAADALPISTGSPKAAIVRTGKGHRIARAAF